MIRIFLFSCLLGMGVLNIATAEEPQLGEPQQGTVTEKHLYRYTIRDYSTPIAVPLEVSQRYTKPNSVEQAAISYFSAMLKGDYGLWLSLWDEESRVKMIQNHHKRNQDAGFWMKWWDRGFSDFDTFYLTKRVDIAEDLFIVEMTASSTIHSRILMVDVPLKKVAPERYLPTQELATSPVFYNWRKKDTVLEKVVYSP